jgi:DNA-binding protein YbaB
MSDEQPDDKEHTRLSALLNRHIPANPGKPRPWVPSDSTRYATRGDATTTGAPEDSAKQGFGKAHPSEPPRLAVTATEFGAAAPPGGQQSPGDLSAVLADGGRATSLMQGRLAELQGTIESAKEQTHEATSADESVIVTVNGRPRVTHLSVGPKAIRSGPEALGAWVVEAVNAATSKARAGAQSALLDGLDPEMRAAIAAEIANATGNKTSNDNSAGAVRPQGGRHA